MAGCSSCHHNKAVRVSAPSAGVVANQKPRTLIVGASDTKNKVQLRYYGGGMGYVTSGCHACGSTGRYSLKTSETIQFASDDAPGGWFSQRFDASHDYYVTEKQAEHLLTLTYTNAAGQTVHKFKKVD